MKIVQFLPEPKTTFRADVAALFGRYLPEFGIECELVCAQAEHGALLMTAKRPNRIVEMLRYLGVCLKKLASIRRQNCDVVQVRDMVSIGLLALCVARLRGIPFCYWMSFLMSEARISVARSKLSQRFTLHQCLALGRGLVERFILYRLVLPNARHIFVQSEAMADYLCSAGVAANRISAVPMGVDMVEFGKSGGFAARQSAMATTATETATATTTTTTTTTTSTAGDAPLLVYLGTLIESRQIETLIDTLELVQQSHRSARLLLIGASNTLAGNQALLDYAQSKGLQESVSITGWLPMQRAWELLVTADVAMSWIPRNLFHDLSSPTKLLEYLAAGIPCVANDIPDQVQVMHQSQAGWLTASDAGSMAEAVLQILADPVAARARAARGPAYIEAHRSYRVISAAVAKSYGVSTGESQGQVSV